MLIFSARDDNIERIELALKNGADVNWPMESHVTTENVRTIRIDIFIYISLLYLICKIYHTVGTVPKSNRKIVEKATSIPITHIYI
jgi:hypothetical protein